MNMSANRDGWGFSLGDDNVLKLIVVWLSQTHNSVSILNTTDLYT